MLLSPGHDDDSKLRGDGSAQRSAPPSLQLPPLALSFPADSTTELPPIQPTREPSAGPSAHTLPPLSSLTSAHSHVPLPKPPNPAHSPPQPGPTNHWPSLNPFTTYYKPSYLDPVESPPSMSSDLGASRSVSLDDPDVRIAAEALGQMRTECASSPRKTSRDYKTASPSPHRNNRDRNAEPLLSLITTSYPLLGTTIEGAASAYNTGKNYSPHIKSGAEYVENLVKPAVETVGRKTGVEGGMRWFFSMRGRKQRSSTDIETDERGNSKRRRSDRNDKGKEAARSTSHDSGADGEDRRMSVSTVDTLPAYDDQKSPAYTEAADDQTPPPPGSSQQWGQRFVVTTSGLGVAMKQESMKSLKYCLGVVKDTNGYLSDILVKLKSVIAEYDLVSQANGEHGTADGHRPAPATAEDRSRLIQRMNELRDDLFRVIHRSVQTVSKYTGGALPENARNLVHSQLMSLPGRYQFHYMRESEGRRENAGPGARTRDSAHLALLFAKEALQMMTQVGEVLNRTLVSAEQWCETLYKEKNEQVLSPNGSDRPLPAAHASAADQDVDMSG
ncbi:transcription factor Opi1-domain-containing protein [Chaetomium sp. MPI-CAGE-AT-0009]|nr:transcription factor Opi1-domain-containing protein [Chaetomium sp. MPI-CAGE-AT-0009]